MPRKASGRKETKKRERGATSGGDEENKRTNAVCVSAVALVAFYPFLDDEAQACDRTRRVAEGHGEAFWRKREKRSPTSLQNDRPRAASRSARERRISTKKKKTSRWGLEEAKARHQNAFQNSQRPARDTGAPVRRGFVMALVCIVGEKAKRGLGTLEAGRRGCEKWSLIEIPVVSSFFFFNLELFFVLSLFRPCFSFVFSASQGGPNDRVPTRFRSEKKKQGNSEFYNTDGK